jgi:hypothetical protein
MSRPRYNTEWLVADISAALILILALYGWCFLLGVGG